MEGVVGGRYPGGGPSDGAGSRTLRLLHLHDRYRTASPSGETTRVLQEAALLRGAGHTVSLKVIDNDEIARWSVARRGTLPLRTVWSPSSHRFVAQEVRRFQPDVVHVHNTLPLASPAVFWAAHRSGVAVVHTLANYRLMCPTATFLRSGAPCEDCLGRSLGWPGVLHACYRASRGASATVAAMTAAHRILGTWHRAVDVFLIGSEFGRQKHIDGGFPAEKIIAKHNTAPDPRRTRRGPGDGYVVVGRLDREKNIEVLLRAWGRAALGEERQLHIVGDGPLRAELEALAARLGVSGVVFHGVVPRSRVTDQLLETRALISPSVAYEVSPINIVEAFAAGVPCVVSSGGAQAELVTDGKDGLHFRSNDDEGLAEALRRLEDDRFSERLGVNARRMYEQRHSAAAVLASLEAAYILAMQGARARSDA